MLALWLLVAWIGYEAVPNNPRRAFAKYICRPIPKSVERIVFQGNDFPLALECQCFLMFSSSSNDLNRIVELTRLEKVQAEGMYVNSSAPSWFVPAQSGAVAQCFRRFFGTGAGGHGCGGKYLWIDATGTNAFFQYVETD